MFKRLIFFSLVIIGAAGLTTSPTPGFATKEIATKEKKSCVTCHTKAGAKDLNELGMYFKEKKTLEGFKKK